MACPLETDEFAGVHSRKTNIFAPEKWMGLEANSFPFRVEFGLVFQVQTAVRFSGRVSPTGHFPKVGGFKLSFDFRRLFSQTRHHSFLKKIHDHSAPEIGKLCTVYIYMYIYVCIVLLFVYIIRIYIYIFVFSP